MVSPRLRNHGGTQVDSGIGHAQKVLLQVGSKIGKATPDIEQAAVRQRHDFTENAELDSLRFRAAVIAVSRIVSVPAYQALVIVGDSSKRVDSLLRRALRHARSPRRLSGTPPQHGLVHSQ